MKRKNPSIGMAAGIGIISMMVFFQSIPGFSRTQSVPAFPGAEGYGSDTPGGRGGKVLFVTTLHDSGEGSLRAACEAEGPRTVVFRVSGLIRLKKPIEIVHPFMTLAGQTAPGDGICLRDKPLVVATHDVVVRFMRSRLGDEGGQAEDCITLTHGARKVILDHCSATWSIDECLSLTGNVAEATVQWCLIAESLDHSKHPKGDHGFGSLARANGPVSLHHNLWAHNHARNPRLGDNYGRPPYPFFDFRNNVIYDFGDICSGITQGRFKVNYVANFIRPGPSSKTKDPILVQGPSDLFFFISGNIFEGHEKATKDNSLFFSSVMIDGRRQVLIADAPFEAPDVKTVSAEDALEAVLAGVGATLPVRDSVDKRIVDGVRRGKGAIINSQNQVGGWPEYRSLPAPQDSDNDGLPDAWEKANGLNPQDPSDRNKTPAKTGYTNLEIYLNGLVQ